MLTAHKTLLQVNHSNGYVDIGLWQIPSHGCQSPRVSFDFQESGASGEVTRHFNSVFAGGFTLFSKDLQQP